MIFLCFTSFKKHKKNIVTSSHVSLIVFSMFFGCRCLSLECGTEPSNPRRKTPGEELSPERRPSKNCRHWASNLRSKRTKSTRRNFTKHNHATYRGSNHRPLGYNRATLPNEPPLATTYLIFNIFVVKFSNSTTQ